MRFVLPSTILLAAVVGCAPSPSDAETRKPAPDFTATTIDGKPVRLSELRGKVVLLDFWATWCGPCKKVTPILKSLHRRYQGRPFVIVGISEDADSSDVEAYLAREEIPWLMIRDATDDDDAVRPIGRQYGVSSIPTLFLIDANGDIRYEPYPFDEGRLAKQIDQLLGETALR